MDPHTPLRPAQSGLHHPWTPDDEIVIVDPLGSVSNQPTADKSRFAGLIGFPATSAPIRFANTHGRLTTRGAATDATR